MRAPSEFLVAETGGLFADRSQLAGVQFIRCVIFRFDVLHIHRQLYHFTENND